MNNPYIYLLILSWKYAVSHRGKLLAVYGMFVIANAIHMLEPYVLGRMLNDIQTGGPDILRTVATYLGIYAALSFLFWVFHGPARVMERSISFHCVKNFTEKMFATIASLPLKWHKDHHSGEVINRLKKASSALRSFTEDSYIFIETIVKFFISLVVIVIFLPTFSGIALVLGIVVVGVIFAFDKYLIKTLEQINEKEHSVSSALFDYIANITTVITLRLQKLAQKEVIRRLVEIFPLFKKNITVNEIKWFVINMILAGINFAIIFLYIYKQVSTGTALLIGNIIALYQYTDRFTNVFFELAWKYEKLVWCKTDMKSIEPIMQAYDQLKISTGSLAETHAWKKIAIKHLSFAYEDEKEKQHLYDVSLTLRRGERVGFIGESGSGKSTMLAVLRGLYETDAVVLEVDERSFTSIHALRNIVTLIPQDPEIFENTIEYNVTAGITHTAEELRNVIAWARFDRVLGRLPKGLATNIKEKGVNLSGGEKQRLAVARGLFAARRSSILLLDEPTSSVDLQNEMAIYKNIFASFPTTCIISSIHRLHLLGLFDTIYLFEKGRIIEHGSLSEMLVHGGVFKKIWDSYMKHTKNV